MFLRGRCSQLFLDFSQLHDWQVDVKRELCFRSASARAAHSLQDSLFFHLNHMICIIQNTFFGSQKKQFLRKCHLPPADLRDDGWIANLKENLAAILHQLSTWMLWTELCSEPKISRFTSEEECWPEHGPSCFPSPCLPSTTFFSLFQRQFSSLAPEQRHQHFSGRSLLKEWRITKNHVSLV